MIRFLLFTIISLSLFGLDLDVKIAKEKGNRYSILNLSSEEEFYCTQDMDYETPINSYTCIFKNAPKTPVKSMETQFFYIFPSVRNGMFVLSVKPKKKSKIFSYDYDPLSDETKQQGFKKQAKKFVIVSYDNELPFVVQKQGVGINFPVVLDTDRYAYVKSLDVNGLPINDNPALNDIKEYAEIKKMVEKGEYKSAIIAIDRIRKIFPNSIFTSEYELFRLKSSLALSTSEGVADIITRAKDWLRNYPTDEKTAEVLLVLANSYVKTQDFNNASYYFDRVINDYETLEISKQAMIDLGDALKPSKPRAAAELYKRALFKTKDIKTASTAAFKLADCFLMLNEGQNAALYAEKILNGNPEYLIKNRLKSFEMAKSIAKLKAYQTSYEIANLLLKDMPQKSEGYEEILSAVGNWAEESGDTSGAKSFYDRYLKEFPLGVSAKNIQARLDKLNFGSIDSKDANTRIKDYDEVIKKYPNDIIAKKALAKKADILFTQNRCDDLLDLKSELLALPKELAGQNVSMIAKCEKSRAISLLKRGDCKEAVSSIKNNAILLESYYDQYIFDCLLKMSDYDNAKALATKHFSDKEIGSKLYWMSNAEKAYARNGEHKNVIELSRDILTLARTLKQPKYNNVAFDMFASAVSIQNVNAMTEAVKIIESIYPNMPETLFVYKEMVKYGLRKSDNLTALNYAKKLYDLQRGIKVYTDTPWIEFTYSELLNKNGDTNRALLVLASLRDKKLNANDKARQLYNASVLWQKQGKKDTAGRLLNECAGLKDDSSWRKLCKDGLEIIK